MASAQPRVPSITKHQGLQKRGPLQIALDLDSLHPNPGVNPGFLPVRLVVDQLSGADEEGFPLSQTEGFAPALIDALSAENIVDHAQGGAVPGYLVRHRDNLKIREICIPSFVSVLFGITEPAIFGVNLRCRYPLIGGCIGGALGGMVVYLTNLAALGFGTTVLPGIDTVQLAGKFFKPHVKNGDTVRKGQLLIKFDLAQIKKAGFGTSIPMLFTDPAGGLALEKETAGAMSPETKIAEMKKA